MPTYPSLSQLRGQFPTETVDLVERANDLIGQRVRAVSRNVGVAVGIYCGVQESITGTVACIEITANYETRIHLVNLEGIEPLVWEDGSGQPGRGAHWDVMLEGIRRLQQCAPDGRERYLDYCANVAFEGAHGAGGVWEIVAEQLVLLRAWARRSSGNTYPRLERLVALIEAQYDLDFEKHKEFAKDLGFSEPERSRFR